MLHHLRDPHLFFDEAARVLRPGGRLLMIEPYITPISYLGYRFLHHETICFDAYQQSKSKDDPWEGNLAMANIVFSRERNHWPKRHPTLRIVFKRKFSILDFQLACGFKPYALVNRPKLFDFLLRLDRQLDGFGNLCGFRILCVIENTI